MDKQNRTLIACQVAAADWFHGTPQGRLARARDVVVLARCWAFPPVALLGEVARLEMQRIARGRGS